MQAFEGLVEEQGLGGYVLVEKQDVLDAIGTFVAAYLASVPEAQNMKPAELQQALSSTFRVSHCYLLCSEKAFSDRTYTSHLGLHV